MSQPNLRRRPRISYCELDEPGADEYIFCSECADFVYEYCSIHGPLLVVPDDKVPAKTNFPSFVPRAALTIPHIFLHIAPSVIPGAGLGVFSSMTLPSDVRFGPYCGIHAPRPNPDSSYCWQIYDGNNKPSHVIDAVDGNSSNWMRYVNCARHWREQNLLAFQYQGQIYYRTIKIVPRFTELLVFYGSEFANALHIDLRLYNSPSGYIEKNGATQQKSTHATNKIVEVTEDDRLKVIVSPSPKKAKTKTNENEVRSDNTKTSCKQENSKNNNKSNKVKKVSDIKRSHQPKTSSTTNKHIKDKNLKKTKIITKNLITSETKFTNTCQETIGKADDKATDQTGVTTRITEVKLDTTKKLSTEKDIFQNDQNNNLETNWLLTNNKKIIHFRNGSNINREDNTINVKLKQDLNFNCSKYKTITRDSLERHMKPNGSCGYRFDEQQNLHREQCNSEAKYSCGICEYKCANKGYLEIHLRVHSKEKPFSCSHCQYKCTTSSRLKRHLRTHTGEKPFSCSHCAYKCTESSNLKRHLRTHTGEKPFSCSHCKYKCTQSSSLKLHLRTHTGEKPFSCSHCQYKCTNRGNLKLHLRTHTGEKPFSCSHCQYKCTTNSSLKLHLRTHTGELPFSC